MKREITPTHEWIEIEDAIATVGLTDELLSEFDEIVGVEFTSSKELKKGELLCVLESIKAAIDIYSPVSGKILSLNYNFLKNKSWLAKLDIK